MFIFALIKTQGSNKNLNEMLSFQEFFDYNAKLFEIRANGFFGNIKHS